MQNVLAAFKLNFNERIPNVKIYTNQKTWDGKPFTANALCDYWAGATTSNMHETCYSMGAIDKNEIELLRAFADLSFQEIETAIAEGVGARDDIMQSWFAAQNFLKDLRADYFFIEERDDIDPALFELLKQPLMTQST